MATILSGDTKKCRINIVLQRRRNGFFGEGFCLCTVKNTTVFIVYKRTMLYNLIGLDSSLQKVERSNVNECY